MSIEPTPFREPVALDPSWEEPGEVVTGSGGPPLSLRVVTSALGRTRRLWLGTAVVGLLVGLGAYKERPAPATAVTTLLLQHTGAPDVGDAMTTDIAILQTPPVAQAVVSRLHLHESALALLGQFTTQNPSNEVLQITLSAPTGAEALQRSRALATAYLAFRADQYRATNAVAVAALNSQINDLQQQIVQLTNELDALPSAEVTAGTGAAAPLLSERTQDVGQQAAIRATMQTDELNTASIVNDSSVLSPPVLNHRSRYKGIVIDGGTGLLVGLLLGVVFVGARALLSDRVRRRDEVAATLRAPVVLNVPRWRRVRLFRGRRLRRRLRLPHPATRSLAEYLEAHTERVPRLLVVAADDPDLAASAVARCALGLGGAGRRAVAVDMTPSGALGRLLGGKTSGTHMVDVGGHSGGVWLMVKPAPTDRVPSNAETLLSLTTVNPRTGTDHLDSWAEEALVVVTPGRNSSERLHMVGELLRLARVPLAGVVLAGPDRDDETLGRLHEDRAVRDPALMPVPRSVDVTRQP